MAVVNDSNAEADLHVRWGGEAPTRYRYRIDTTHRDRTDVRVDPQGEFAGDFDDTLPPMSLTVDSTHCQPHDDRSPHC